ncbi:hypothetical protein [Cohnella sp. LGH]|uniref:hypothetical protein n=1 Tax=Cohnella sp. LGH TaxID=1619153 RepID=UPI001FFE0A8A|nr:hypothetical protein [Cohnella sp. LGH]
MGTCKPFGWEVLDIRYGGALARLDTAIERLAGYLSGRVERLEELEECRLYFDGPRTNEWHSIGSINAYSRSRRQETCNPAVEEKDDLRRSIALNYAPFGLNSRDSIREAEPMAILWSPNRAGWILGISSA